MQSRLWLVSSGIALAAISFLTLRPHWGSNDPRFRDIIISANHTTKTTFSVEPAVQQLDKLRRTTASIALHLQQVGQLDPNETILQFHLLTHSDSQEWVVDTDEANKSLSRLMLIASAIPKKESAISVSDYKKLSLSLDDVSRYNPRRMFHLVATSKSTSAEERAKASDLASRWVQLSELQSQAKTDAYLTVAEFERSLDSMRRESDFRFASLERQTQDNYTDKLIALISALGIVGTGLFAWRADQRESRRLMSEVQSLRTTMESLKHTSEDG